MRTHLLWLPALLLALAGCSGGGSSDGGISGNKDAGGDAGVAGFDLTDLTVAGQGPNQRVAAALSADGRIGVAYYWDVDEAHRNIEFLELQTDGTTHAQTIAAGVQRLSQLSVGYDPQGNAVVGFFGNDPNLTEGIENPGVDGGVFWTESDLGVATITPAGALATVYPVHGYSDDVQTGNPVDQNTSVVGQSPAVTFEGNQTVVLFRNTHSGQFPQQDYGKSNLEAVVGSGGSFTPEEVVHGTDGNFVQEGPGAATHAASLNGVTVAATSGQIDLDAKLQRLLVAVRSNGAWGNQQELFTSVGITGNLGGDNESGPSVAADPQAGFGLAWVDRSASIVHYASSPDGVNWSGLESAFGSGTGGWYPSLAFDPSTGLPAIAYYVCSITEGVQSCPADEDELRVSVRRSNATWAASTVDASGGIYPTLLFNGGQMVVVYRSLETGGVRIARQRAQ